MMRMVTIMKGKSLDCEHLYVVSPDRKALKYLAGEEPRGANIDLLTRRFRKLRTCLLHLVSFPFSYYHKIGIVLSLKKVCLLLRWRKLKLMCYENCYYHLGRWRNARKFIMLKISVAKISQSIVLYIHYMTTDHDDAYSQQT